MAEEKEIILSVKDLEISFKTDEGLLHAVRGVSFDLYKGETLCIVGESGSGKSVTSKTIMGILPASAVIDNGSVMYEGEDLTQIDESEFHRIRGNKIGMIFQDPLSSLNPIKKVGKQITEAMLVNKNILKLRKDSLISKESAAYKNNLVVYKRTVAKAKNAIALSDSKYDMQIVKLENNYNHEEDQLMVIPKEEVDAKKAELKEMRAELKKQTKVLEAEKKKEHKRLTAEYHNEKRAAKALYKEKKPGLKVALKKREKEADVEIKRYKEEETAKYNEAYAALKKECDAKIKADEQEVEAFKASKKNSHSEILAKQEIEKRENEHEELVNECEKKLNDLEVEYKSKFKITRKIAKQRALNIMEEVGIPQPEVRFNQYPFEFSGGMRQRIVIAIALMANPEVLICDEPTTALDVTIQAQILELINQIKKDRNMSIIFITHDLGVVANMADRVAVMYAGKIVEVGTANEIFYEPRHPYTWALLSSIPDLDSKEKLEAIPGTPPYLLNPPKGDAFADRNKYALAIDFKQEPPTFRISETHYASTWLLDKRAPKTEPPKIVTQRIKISLDRAKKAGINYEPGN